MATKQSYTFDAFLLYLIQDVTKRPTAEILNFFNELGKAVSEIGTEKRTGSGIRKDITDYFPGTSIPFHMLVKGHKRNQNWNNQTKMYEGISEFMMCYVEIGFPDKAMHIKAQDLDEIAVAIMEKALMDGEEVNMPLFVKPEFKSPKMYKSLMDSFAGRPESETTRKKRVSK